MARTASRKKGPGLTRRIIRSTMRVGMLATAVLVGRKTAGGSRAREGQGGGGSGGREAPGGLGAAAGGSQGAGHETDPRAVDNGQQGRQAEVPQQIPPKGWLAIAKRTLKEVKQDQVPLLAAGSPSTFCWRCSRRSSPGSPSMGWSLTQPRSRTRSPT